MLIFDTLSLTAGVETHIRNQMRREAPLLYLTFELLGSVARAGKYIFVAPPFITYFLITFFKAQFPSGSPQYTEMIHIITWTLFLSFVIAGAASLGQKQCWKKLEPRVQRAAKNFS